MTEPVPEQQPHDAVPHPPDAGNDPTSPPLRAVADDVAAAAPPAARRGRPAAGRRNTTRAQAAAGAAAAVVAAVVLGTWTLASLRGVLASQPIDFRVYFLAADVWAHHGDPYSMSRAAWFAFGHHTGLHQFVWPYRYPPYTAALLRPVLGLGEPAVLALWQTASVAAMLASAWIVARALGGGRLYAVAFLLLAVLAPAYDTLLVGQINGFLLLSLAVALWAMLRRRERVLGLSLAAGTALKLVPAALILYLVLTRRRRAVVWSVVGLLTFTVAALPFVGWHAFAEYARWGVDLVRPGSVMNGPTNVTFVGAVGRLLTHDLPAARTVGRVLAAAVVIATVALVWPRRGRSRDDALAFALIVAALPLLPPFTWFHQLLTLLVPLLVLGERLWHSGRRWELALVAALLAATDAAWITLDPGYWLGLRVPAASYRLSFATLFTLALWALCARELWRPAPPREASVARSGPAGGDARPTYDVGATDKSVGQGA